MSNGGMIPGETWTVTGIVAACTNDYCVITRQRSSYEGSRLKVGDLVLKRTGADGGVRKIKEFDRASLTMSHTVASLEGVSEACWLWGLRHLTEAEKEAYETEAQKQKQAEWKTVVSEIPTDILLDVIKERTTK
jgi:hypothetical protein